MILEKLQQLGLSAKDAQVYLAALELGGESVQNIAKKARVNRATTYLCLEKLSSLKLVSIYKKGKKIKYFGEQPEKLLSNIFEEQSRLKQREIEITGLLPELRAIFNFSKDKPRVRFFEGIEGVKEIYQDSLVNNEEILAFISVAKIDKKLLAWLEKEYTPERVIRKIFVKAIAPADMESKWYRERGQKQQRETKLVDPKKYPLSVEICIYNNRVALISNSSREMFGVIVESGEVYQTMKFIFQMAWNQE